MIENSKNSSNCCKFCGWEFRPDILQRISDNKGPVLCEFCGIEITVSSINIQEKRNKRDSLNSTNKDGDSEKKKNSIVKNISKRIQPTKYSVSVISGDENFPRLFKENLIIVISRLIYSFIKEWEHENSVSVSRVSLERKILNYFRERISPILEKRVHEKFLRNLFKINREDFEHWLKLLQEKLALDQDYNAHFKVFLTWVIKIVFKLVSEMWDRENLPKLHATILKDLKEYDFDPQIFRNKYQNINEIRTLKKLFHNGEQKIERMLESKQKNYRYDYRIQVEKNQLTEIFKNLKERGYSLEKVKKLINFDFKYAFYKGGSIDPRSFKKLEELVGYPIPHSIKEPIIRSCNLLESEDLAELIGVLLGDGNVSKKYHTLSVTLNQIEEPNYVNYIKKLIKSTLKREPSVVDLPNNKAIQLRVYDTGIINVLLSKGLKSGNKVKNQVGVPLWIKKNHRFTIACLRGLIDTDGSIFIARRDNFIHINFKNNSKPLVEDFKEMCDNLQIRASKVHSGWTHSRGKKFRHYKVSICAKDQVAKFIYIINPMKWNFRLKNFKKFLKSQGLLVEGLFRYKREKNLRYYCQKVVERLNEIE